MRDRKQDPAEKGKHDQRAARSRPEGRTQAQRAPLSDRQGDGGEGMQ